ncbi:MAG TPA: glycosyltransferase family 39 protein [Acidimicrobiales bacterium]|nr:glycosyltransferase family 39 protein [Acidimicrobiales bacterium]
MNVAVRRTDRRETIRVADTDDSRRSGRVWPTNIVVFVVIFALAALGVYLRLWSIGNNAINSDQAVVGLAARDILHGHFTTFYWGQNYGGVEPYAVALGFLVFGTHAWVVNATAALLSAVAALLVWRLGVLVSGNTVVAALAAAITWIWPESDVWNSTREYGFRGVVLVCGLVVLIAAVRILQSRDTRWTWLVFGAGLGLGCWASPEIVYFALPSVIAVAIALFGRSRSRIPLHATSRLSLRPSSRAPTTVEERRSVTGDVCTAFAGAVLFALPWIITNLRSGFASLSEATAGDLPGNTYLHRLRIFFVDSLPMSFGARTPASGAWLGGRDVGLVITVLVSIVVVTGVVTAAAKLPASRLLVGYVVAYPFIYAAMIPTEYWRDGRYAVFFAPVLVPLVVAGVDRFVRDLARRRHLFIADSSRRWTRVVVAALAAAALSVATVEAFTSSSPLTSTAFDLTPTTNPVGTAVVTSLSRDQIEKAYADYWVAYSLDMIGDEKVTVSPVDSVRNRSLARKVDESHDPAWLFVGPTSADRASDISQFTNPGMEPFGLTPVGFTNLLRRSGIRYRVVQAATMTAVVPARLVTPASILRDLQ